MLNLTKSVAKTLKLTLYLMEKDQILPYKIRFLFNIIMEVLANARRHEKETGQMILKKNDIKLSLFTDGI